MEASTVIWTGIGIVLALVVGYAMGYGNGVEVGFKEGKDSVKDAQTDQECTPPWEEREPDSNPEGEVGPEEAP